MVVRSHVCLPRFYLVCIVYGSTNKHSVIIVTVVHKSHIHTHKQIPSHGEWTKKADNSKTVVLQTCNERMDLSIGSTDADHGVVYQMWDIYNIKIAIVSMCWCRFLKYFYRKWLIWCTLSVTTVDIFSISSTVYDSFWCRLCYVFVMWEYFVISLYSRLNIGNFFSITLLKC